MIIKQELIKKIRSYFDLNIYETKVWLALLTRGVSTAGEIAEMSGVPRSRTYDVLESLEKRGFAIEKLGKPVKYLAVKPEVVIEKIKNNTVQHAEERVKTLENLKDTSEFAELKALHKSGVEPINNRDLSGSIKGRTNLYSQMRAVMENADKLLYIITSKHELILKQRMFLEMFAKLKKRNVVIKVMIPDSDEEVKKLSKKFGVPMKSKSINARFIIADKKELIFTIKPTDVHEDFDHGIWITSEYFTNSLAYMFEVAWKD